MLVLEKLNTRMQLKWNSNKWLGGILMSFMTLILFISWWMYGDEEIPGKPSQETQDTQFVRNHKRIMATAPAIFLTIFTTFREQDKDRAKMFEATLHNWASLGYDVKPVLFVSVNTDTGASSNLWNTVNKERNWDVLRVPKTNPYGTPCVNAMFKMVFEKYDSLFYGYANGDILFSDDLILTLKSVDRIIQAGDPGRHLNVLPPPFIVGRRRLLKVKSDRLKQVQELGLWTKYQVSEECARRIPDKKCNVDYFFMYKDSYPWHKLPDLVIGRCYYDVYLLMVAMYHNMTTIDATETLCALHLQGEGMQFTHQTANNKDEAYNFWQIERYGEIMDYMVACIDSCGYLSKRKCNHIALEPNCEIEDKGSSLDYASRRKVQIQLYNYKHNITHTLTEVPSHLQYIGVSKINFP